ncbi:MAG TPA: ABC transporter substrate-binding protein [Acidimicrobiales bacterium]|nr:ABC transporter substrate-binding protein [Acidimicrobiales bacterium]
MTGFCVASSGASTKAKLVSYNIGIITSSTGSGATTLSVNVPTMNAWARSVNAVGGIKHHKVKIFLAQDSDAASALTAVQNLVKSDHIVALFDNSSEDYAFQTYVDSIKLPVVGTLFNGALYGKDNNWHTTGSPTSNLGVNLLTVIQKAGKSKIAALYCAEYAACNVVNQLFGPYLSSTGTSLSYVASISGTAPNYAAQCLAAQQAGAQALVVFEPGQIGQKVMDNCAAQGYTPLFVSTSSLAVPAWLNDASLNGAELFSADIPDFVSSTPATKAEFAALGKYEPTVLTSQYFSEEVPNTWISGKMLQLAMTNGNLGNHPTMGAVAKGFNTFKNETFGGMAPPLTIKNGTSVIPSCVFTEVISSGHWTLNNGLNLSCPSS